MIQTYLKQILNAVYGRDVRQSIHDAIHQCYEDGKAGELDLIAREGVEKIQNNIANPNMLLNGNFAINQRGGTTYINTNTWKYSVDRWRYIGVMNVIVNEDKTVTLKKENNASETYFTQSLEHPNYSGNYTLSFEVKEITGTLSVYIEGGSAEILEVNESGVYVIHSNTGANGIVFRLDGTTTSVTLKWVKLEHGNIATPFVPRLYGEELALCQRYYTRLSTTYPMLITHRATSDTKTYIFVPTPQSLLDAPTIEFENVKLLRGGVGGSWWDVSNVTCVGYSNMGVTLQLDCDAALEANVPYYLILPNSGYIKMESEIKD